MPPYQVAYSTVRITLIIEQLNSTHLVLQMSDHYTCANLVRQCMPKCCYAM